MHRAASQTIAAIERAVRVALALLLVAMVLLNAAAAGARYLLGEGLIGSDELLVFAMIWVVFIGAALLEREGRHLSFDLIFKHLPARPRHALAVAINVASAAVLAVVAWQSAVVIERLASLGQVSMGGGVPMSVPHAAVLAGLSLAAIACVATAVRELLALGADGRAAGETRGGT